MTKITFYRQEDGSYLGFDAQDHAGYDVSGQDIVCAAISAMVINFVNSLEEFTADSFHVDQDSKNARINVVFKDRLSNEGSLLLRSLILGLTSIEEEHEQHLDIIYEEV